MADTNRAWLLGCCSFIARWSDAQTWDRVAASLAGHGYEVGIPDLTGTVAAGPPYYQRQAEVIAGSVSGRPAILIGHSGAGPLLATLGSIIDQVRGYIFVDAGPTVPGQTAMETMPPDLAAQLREMADADGWLPPWPQWWGDEVLAELISDTDTRRRFAPAAPGRHWPCSRKFNCRRRTGPMRPPPTCS